MISSGEKTGRPARAAKLAFMSMADSKAFCLA